MKSKKIKKDLFKVEELEPRLEMIWDDNGCANGDNNSCGGGGGGIDAGCGGNQQLF